MMKFDFSKALAKPRAGRSGTGFQPVFHGQDLPARSAQAGAHATRGFARAPSIYRWVLAALLLGAALRVADAADYAHPVLRVPRLDVAPELDGRIDEAQWAQATRITGMVGNPLGEQVMVPTIQQVEWWLGFDDEFLYLAMRSPHPKGIYPLARIKAHGDPLLVHEDHVEVQFIPHAERELATRPARTEGMYKFVINPYAAVDDRHWFNGEPGTEDLWSGVGQCASHVTDEVWELELSIRRDRIETREIDTFDGQRFVMELVRADTPTGMYYAGITGKRWSAWDSFAQVDFDQATPTFQMRGLGPLEKGRLDARFDLRGNSAILRAVTVEVAVEDADGKILFADSQTATVTQDQIQSLRFTADELPITRVGLAEAARNHWEIRAHYQEGDQTVTLYHVRAPFARVDAEWEAAYIEPWLAARPRGGDWEAKIVHWASAHLLYYSIDTDLLGVAPAIKAAASYTVEVRDANDRQIAVRQGLLRQHAAAEEFVLAAPLPEGRYTAEISLLAADGGEVARKSLPFVRRVYAWENNQLGLQDELVPPYVPMAVNSPRIWGPGGPNTRVPVAAGDLTVSTWGQSYAIGGNGLPAKLFTVAPSGTIGGLENLLAAPVALALQVGGQRVAGTPAEARIITQDIHRVRIAGGEEFADLAVETAVTHEYEGWYEVELRIEPRRATTVESLDMLVDFRDHPGDRQTARHPIDAYGVGAMFGAIPSTPGIQARGSMMPTPASRIAGLIIPKDWKTFVPHVFVGNGDRGLWLYFWSDRGWELQDDQECVLIERLADGNVRLRVRFLAGPVVLDGPRTIRFALQAIPMKPNDRRYRVKSSEIYHQTAGFRYWGDSVDSFVQTQAEDYEELRKTLLVGSLYQEGGADAQEAFQHNYHHIGATINEGGNRFMLYGSQWMTGLGAEEFDTFGGEWLGSNAWDFAPHLKFMNQWNSQRTQQWDTARKCMAERVNWPRSFVDFFVWHHDQLIEKAGINGTWWDNSYYGLITDFDPELGRLDSVWHHKMRRDLTKRLNLIGWQHMRQPTWAMNSHMGMPWTQVLWLIEGNFYGSAPGASLANNVTATRHFAQFANTGRGADWFRANVRSRSTVLIPKPFLRHFRGATPAMDLKIKRSVVAMLLSHDIGGFQNRRHKVDYPHLHKLHGAVRYEDASACLFAGYWKTAPFVTTKAPDVLTSVYQDRERGVAALLFHNTGDEDVSLGGILLDAATLIGNASFVPSASRPVTVTRVYDVESGAPVNFQVNPDGRVELIGPLLCEWHDFRLIALTTE